MDQHARAIEILEAINEYFQERDGQTALYSDAQILEGDATIKDAIAACLGSADALEEKIIPHSQRRKYSYSPYTGWSGWIGKRKVRRFDSMEEAIKWTHLEE